MGLKKNHTKHERDKMKGRKLYKYSCVSEFPNVLEPGFKWGGDNTGCPVYDPSVFPTEGPLIIEIGCGKGDYSLALARRNPEKNYMGIDIKGARIYHGALEALEEGISNLSFLRTQIEYLDLFFPQDSVSEIWITFPDPHLKKENSAYRKRLTAPRFLSLYKKFLKPGSFIHLKTDSQTMFSYTADTVNSEGLNIVDCTEDLYSTHGECEATSIQTNYEKKYLALGIPIKYLKLKMS